MKKAAPIRAAFFLSTLLLAPPPIHADPCGTIVIPSAIGQDDPAPVTSLNPLIGNSTYNQQSAMLLYRPLVWVGQNGQIDPDRSLAQSITPLDGNTRFLVTLKPWRWSDDQPVTADDVAYTWSLITQLGPVFAYAGQGGLPDRIASVRAIDATHAEFAMKSPTNPNWFELEGLSVFPALPRHAWGAIGRDELWQRQTDPTLVAVVDGPFHLENFVPDRFISYVPNPLYGGHQAQAARLVIDFLEGGSALHALRAGEVDMAQIPLTLWDNARATPHTTALTLPEPFGYASLTFNLRQDRTPFFRDARVRRALTDATGQRAMIDIVFRGASAENRVPIPADAAFYRSDAVRQNRLPVRTDRALAGSELDQAGWRRGPDGVRAKDGVRLEFTTLFTTGSDARAALMQILQQNLRAVGVAMHIRQMDFNQLSATEAGPPDGWDAVLASWTLTGFPDGTGYYDTDGANNAGGYSNPRMDALIRASTGQSGLAALFAYQDMFASEQPVNILPQGEIRLLVSDRVRGLDEFVNAEGFISPEYLSVASAICPAAPATAGTLHAQHAGPGGTLHAER
jgi:peptide/nickel transport system substrate-binding protein